MSALKISFSLSDSLVAFVESYGKEHGLDHQQVFEEAVGLLRSRELEAAYRDAASASDEAWENTVTDGLDGEAW